VAEAFVDVSGLCSFTGEECMAGVRKLQTLTEAFWRDHYEVSESDLDSVTSLILEAGKPQHLDTLVTAIILRRVQREKETIARQANRKQIYQPARQYQVGQEVLFSVLDFAEGRVTAVRPGHNPKYSSFDVIRVLLEGEQTPREFVASFDYPHALNRPLEELLGAGDEEVSESELLDRFSGYVANRLETRLRSRDEFVYLAGVWFLRELLPEVHVGYLNLAEAIIDEARHPLLTSEILKSLDITGGGSPDAQVFALDRALAADGRFDRVKMGDRATWYLVALQPQALARRPEVLQPAFRATGGEYVGLTMLDQIDEIGDELDDVGSTVSRPADSVQFEVSFPHLYAGTMPATAQFLRLLPTQQQDHFPMTMVDTRTSKRYDVWVVPEHRYVCGLGEWYQAMEMCVGGEVSISPTAEAMTFDIAATPVRGRRSEWVRSAAVVDGRLVLQMQRASIGVRADRNMLTDVPDRQPVADLVGRLASQQPSLPTLVRMAFEELAKLNSKGVVHSKSIYAVANMLRRTGAVPIFAELTRRACYDPVGDGFWAYESALEGTVYRTADDMRERPLSTRGDLIKDQVVQYLGR
jgi:hypothetical protein